MPFYWGDYLQKTGHLSTLEHGAYVLLIGHLWTSDGSMADDDARLARITKCTGKDWLKLRPVLEAFFEIKRGLWKHDRVSTELKRAKNIYEKRAEAGRNSTIKRNELPRSPNGHREQTDTVTAPQPESQAQLQIKKERVLEVVGQSLGPKDGGKPWTAAQKKGAWQGRIGEEARLTMTDSAYLEFMQAWTLEESWAVKLAEQIDRKLKAMRGNRVTA